MEYNPDIITEITDVKFETGNGRYNITGTGYNIGGSGKGIGG